MKTLILPNQNEIDEAIDNYAFRVPYDGSNNFYDEIALKHFKAGIEWMKSKIKVIKTGEQEDIPEEFQEIVNEELFNLI